MRKQNIFDFLEEHQKEIRKAKPEFVFDESIQKKRTIYPPNYLVVLVDEYRGIALMRYPPRPMDALLCPEGEKPARFEFVLLQRDFPWRNKVPVFGSAKDKEGKPIVQDWVDGGETLPGIACQRFLDSGEHRYIPKYVTRSADETKEDVKKLLTHGKYHFGSSVNI